MFGTLFLLVFFPQFNVVSKSLLTAGPGSSLRSSLRGGKLEDFPPKILLLTSLDVNNIPQLIRQSVSLPLVGYVFTGSSLRLLDVSKRCCRAAFGSGCNRPYYKSRGKCP